MTSAKALPESIWKIRSRVASGRIVKFWAALVRSDDIATAPLGFSRRLVMAPLLLRMTRSCPPDDVIVFATTVPVNVGLARGAYTLRSGVPEMLLYGILFALVIFVWYVLSVVASAVLVTYVEVSTLSVANTVRSGGSSKKL